ncbi:hypothetical protein C0585_04480 [Candidatus Woesearchaeota archaeon]|nr:MAG: hypothetical protein C0585_04480 [Candidatus Woesearchaeota archaeon]
MKHSASLGFGKIISDVEITKDIIDSFIEGYEVNKKLIDWKPPKDIKIEIYDDENNFKKALGKKYEKWISGFVHYNGKLIIKSYNLRKNQKEKSVEINNERDYYKEYSFHELNHTFWRYNFKTWKPKWMLEGLACYTERKKYDEKDLLASLSNKKKNYINYTGRSVNKKNIKDYYIVWEGLLFFMINKYGIEKIKLFLEQYSKRPIKENYKKLFEKYFNLTENQFYREFISSFKKQKKLFQY